MTHDDLPLFAWSPPPCRIYVLPLARDTRRVRDVARKMSEKTTDRHATYYRDQVTEAALKRLDRYEVPDPKKNEMVQAFWRAVDMEVARLTYRGSRPGGAA